MNKHFVFLWQQHFGSDASDDTKSMSKEKHNIKTAVGQLENVDWNL